MFLWFGLGLIGALFLLWIHYREYDRITIASVIGYNFVALLGPICFIVGFTAALVYLLGYTKFLDITLYKKKGD